MTVIQTKTDDQFSLFRHVRNGKVVDGSKRTSNLGGVTLYLDVDQPSATFKFAFAVCGDGDNFNKQVAKDISFGRYKAGQVLEGAYDRTISLVDNCTNILYNFVNNSHPDTIAAVKRSQAVAALNRLQDYTKKLPRVPFTGKRVPKTVVATAAPWPFPKAEA